MSAARPLAMAVDIFAAIVNRLPVELKPYLPRGYGIRAINDNAVRHHHGSLVISNHGVVQQTVAVPDIKTYYYESPSLTISLHNTCLIVSHYFKLTEDWPYRKGGSGNILFKLPYNDPDLLPRLGEYVAELDADPHFRTAEWKPRNPPGYKAREQYRLKLIAQIRALGVTYVRDDWSLAMCRANLEDLARKEQQ